MPPKNVVVYTRAGCHLCDVACETLERYGLDPTKIDITTDPALLAKYQYLIPVVVLDGQERFRGRIDEILLQRLL